MTSRPVALLAAGFALLMAANYAFLGTVPYPLALLGANDYCDYFAPLALLQSRSVAEGEIAMWNPLVLCGVPIAANPQAASFYPPNLIRAIVSVPWATPESVLLSLRIMILLHYAVAFVGSIFLARHYELPRLMAFAVATIFTFSTFFICTGYASWVLMATSVWLPLGLWMLLRAQAAADGKTWLRWSAAAGLVFGLATLAGQVQTVMYMWLIAAIIIVGGSVLNPSQATQSMYRRLGWAIGSLAIASVLSILIGAVTILPAAQLTEWSTRSHEANAILSYRHNALVLWPYHCHVVPPVLALIAVSFGSRRREIGIYFIALIVAIDMLAGHAGVLSRLLRSVAPFPLTSPNWSTPILMLPLALLSGFGLDALVRSNAAVRTRAIALGVLGILSFAVAAAWSGPFPIGPVSLVSSALFIVGAVVLIASRWRVPLAIVLVTLLTGELVVWNNSQATSFLAQAPSPDNVDLDRAANFDASHRRTMTIPGNYNAYMLEPVVHGIEPIMLRDTFQVISNEQQAQRQHDSVVTHEEITLDNHRPNLLLKRMFWLAWEYVEGPLPPKRSLFPPTTTVFLEEAPHDSAIPRRSASDAIGTSVVDPILVAYPSRTRTTSANGTRAVSFAPLKIPAAHSAFVIEIQGPTSGEISVDFIHPDGSVTHGTHEQVQLSAGQEQRLEWTPPEALTVTPVLYLPADSPVRNPTRCVLLQDGTDEIDKLEVIKIAANEARVRVGSIDAPRILLFTDSYYPGWTATIDGAPTKILRADDAFKAVVVPEGTHEVVFRFRPKIVYAGLTITTLATLITLAAIAILTRRPKPLPAVSSE